MASFCLLSKVLRSIAGMIAPPARRRSTVRAIDRDRGETLPANRSCKPHVLMLDRTRQRTACTTFDSDVDARTKDNASLHGLVMTGHNARDDQGPVEKEGGDGGPLKLLT